LILITTMLPKNLDRYARVPKLRLKVQSDLLVPVPGMFKFPSEEALSVDCVKMASCPDF
jgi:hypothetical protein